MQNEKQLEFSISLVADGKPLIIVYDGKFGMVYGVKSHQPFYIHNRVLTEKERTVMLEELNKTITYAKGTQNSGRS